MLLALRTRRPALTVEIGEENVVGACSNPRRVELLGALGFRSSMAVSLVARGRAIGVITFVGAVAGRRYGPRDVALAEELARRAAISIDNARLYYDAKEAIRLRDEFLQVASHELNTPVTALKLTLEPLVHGKRSLSPERVRRTLAVVGRQSIRLASLIGEMLAVARMHPGAPVELRLEEVDLAGIVRDAIELLRDELARSRCPVSLRIDGSVVGRWDRVRLEQVVNNVISNAMKFGPDKPIEITLQERAGTARLVIRDRGIGVEPERLPHIFERFVRAVSADSYGGLGLGLYIVREIVVALGGSVHAESILGEGSTFTIELPCAGP